VVVIAMVRVVAAKILLETLVVCFFAGPVVGGREVPVDEFWGVLRGIYSRTRAARASAVHEIPVF
jgi:hypothetical protein